MQLDSHSSANAGGPPFSDEDGFLPKQYRHDYAGTCWWCGSAADSREHRHKRTDAKRLFGPGPWRGDDAVVRGIGGNLRKIQGPDSAELKFAKVICSACNSSRSQQYDFSYDIFASYVMENASEILRASRFSWSSAFPGGWAAGKNQVTAYWLKHIGCRMAEDGVLVDPSIGRFLDNPTNVKDVPLRLTLEIRDDIVTLERHANFRGLYAGGMTCDYSTSRSRIWRAWSSWGLSWLRLNYYYEENICGSSNFSEEDVILPHGFDTDPTELKKHLSNAEVQSRQSDGQ